MNSNNYSQLQDENSMEKFQLSHLQRKLPAFDKALGSCAPQVQARSQSMVEGMECRLEAMGLKDTTCCSHSVSDFRATKQAMLQRSDIKVYLVTYLSHLGS